MRLERPEIDGGRLRVNSMRSFYSKRPLMPSRSPWCTLSTRMKPGRPSGAAEFNIHGLARCDLIHPLPDLSPSRLSRQLRRLRVPGLLKRAANTYCYYLTRAGRMAIAAFERLTTFAIVPALASA